MRKLICNVELAIGEALTELQIQRLMDKGFDRAIAGMIEDLDLSIDSDMIYLVDPNDPDCPFTSEPVKPNNFYIVYKPDCTENYTRTATSEGEVLDEIMLSKDGDLANYEIFEQII